MNILLDTHTLIWYIEGNSMLKSSTIEILENKDNKLNISIASLWEMSIKFNLGKLNLSVKFKDLLEILTILSIDILPISFEDTVTNLNLKFHHKDPFDRIIISQAMNNHLLMMSNDSIFDMYKLKRIW